MRLLRGRRRGSVLLLSVFFLMFLSFIASAFMTLIPMEAHAARRIEQDVAGALAADAGVTDALEFLRDCLAPIGGGASKEPMNVAVYPNAAARTVQVGRGWHYVWECIPDAQTYPNGASQIRAYRIVSKAYLNNVVKRQATAWVLQDSFSTFHNMSHTWPSNLVHPVGIGTRMPGKMHTNGTLRLWLKNGASYWTDTGQPHFSQGVTASGTYDDGSASDGFAYYEGNWSGSDANKKPYNSSGPINSRYNRISVGGRSAMVSGYQEQAMVKSSFDMRDAAWAFSTDPKPTTNGVYVHRGAGGAVDGGIYIRGDVNEMVLGVGGSDKSLGINVPYGNNSWVKVEQGSQDLQSPHPVNGSTGTTVVTVTEAMTLPVGAQIKDATSGILSTLTSNLPVSTGSTLVRNPNGSFTVYPGSLNGMVYSTGDVNNLWGTNKGRRTIAAEMRGTYNAAGDLTSIQDAKKVYIGAEHDPTNGFSNTNKGLKEYGVVDADSNGVLDTPSSGDNVLGVVAYEVMVKKTREWPEHTEANPIYLMAAFYGGLPDSDGGVGVEGYNTGSTVGGWVHTFGGKIQSEAHAWGVTDGRGLTHGTNNYNPHIAQNPPPYFPALPSFTVKAYQETVP